MAQFDVHRLGNSEQLVVDCQSGLLDHIDSRFVIPLVPQDKAPPPARRLNPIFEIDGTDHVLLTQSATAIRRRELGAIVASLVSERLKIIGALDLLISGV